MYEGADAWLGQENLIVRAADWFMRVLGQVAFVRSPSELGGRRALFVEAFDGPRVDELVDRLGHRRHLGIALGNVNDFRACRLAEPGKRSFGLALGLHNQPLECSL